MSDEPDVVQAKVWEAGLAAFQYNSGLPKRRGLWHRFRYWLRRPS